MEKCLTKKRLRKKSLGEFSDSPPAQHPPKTHLWFSIQAKPLIGASFILINLSWEDYASIACEGLLIEQSLH